MKNKLKVSVLAFSTVNPSQIADAIKIFVELVKLKIDLKGEKPKSIETVDAQTKITNADGNVTYVDNRTINIFKNNSIVNSELEKNFQVLEEDPKVTGYQLLNSRKQKLIDIDREEFKHLSSSISSDDRLSKSVDERTDLRVLKVVFDRRYKWEFIYNGLRISAKILDEVFLNEVDSGERFGKGDILTVTLRINKDFDEVINTFVNTSYEVMKVLEHIPRGEQLSLWKEKRSYQ